LYINGKKIE